MSQARQREHSWNVCFGEALETANPRWGGGIVRPQMPTGQHREVCISGWRLRRTAGPISGFMLSSQRRSSGSSS